jgi:uncharacterized lipoprotein NlpE involved in copper resistance
VAEMNKLILVLIICILLIAGCSNNSQINGNAASGTSDIDKLELYHFHGTNQCYSCITVGAYAEETVNTYFADELKSGKIVFSHLNYDVDENKELASKYGVTGSSLWLGVYDAKGFHAEQNVNVWYKINNKAEYMSYLKGVIEKRLSGDLS